MKETMKTAEELSTYIKRKMSAFEKDCARFVGEEEGDPIFRERFIFFNEFLQNVGSHILNKTSAIEICETSSILPYKNKFKFAYNLNQNQSANFWLNLGDSVRYGLHGGVYCSFISPEKIKGSENSFLKRTISKKIRKKPFLEGSFDYCRIANNEHFDINQGDVILGIGTTIINESYHDSMIEEMLDTRPEELTTSFQNYFDKIYETFKPVADSLERNFSKFPQIFEEKNKAESEYKAKIREISDKLFE